MDSVEKIKKCEKVSSRKVSYKFLVGKNTGNEIVTEIKNIDLILQYYNDPSR